MKICQSLSQYVGNPLYKSDNAPKAGVWMINTGFSGIIT